MNYPGLLVLVSFLSVSVFANPELKGQPEELRQFLHPADKTVTIYAHAEQTAYSDKAIIQLVVSTDESLLSRSLAANSELRNKISQQLMAKGIKAEHINSSKFSTSPQYGWFGKKPNSFKVVNRMAISIFDERQLQALAKVADEYEQAEISGTSFEHIEKDKFEQAVKKDALDKVLAKKAFYERSLGVKLEAVAFRDEQVLPQATAGAQLVEEVVVSGRRESESRLMSKQVSYDSYESSPARTFDEVKYRAVIFVDFKISK
ncbi:hypothetical protein SAMN02745866_01066 [Alteromonadaceae bacterium Bs31]|nr:hypothetical protein SAMN02745866_01066 [Alteromonadaceae bacterium Bs31]